MGKFSALGNQLIYASSHDPASETKSGKNDKHSIGVWGRGGKVQVEAGYFSCTIRFTKVMLLR
ncbi:hypothetical protein DPMN_144631 [Dreissena polymorpha]|uniref:Uncharacterized protein n=1 Tax=Dreissena polymorpha TaxID=45954 RepID=A0A9D4IWS0_DREPO|nr:hypothetical protein DPMN_144631 [Dreissena polymorpha]